MTKPYEWTGLGVQSLNSAIHRINHHPAEKITAELHLYLYFKFKFIKNTLDTYHDYWSLPAK